MNKTLLLSQIITSLGERLDVMENAARASHAEATHESSKADNKYDTRGLEAAYLAGGQSRQAKEIQESIKAYQLLAPKDFGPGQPIDIAAVVDLDANGVRSTYFIGPRNGGLEIVFQGMEITIVTPHSPLGQSLMGHKAGDRWATRLGGAAIKYHIISVH